MAELRALQLLSLSDWGEDTPLLSELRRWPLYAQLTDMLRSLHQDALFRSRVHGRGHIGRVLIFSGLIACREKLSSEDTQLLLYAAAYHDVGRVMDGLDLAHGSRSAEKLPALTGLSGEELCLVQGAVAAHSQPDLKLTEMVAAYAPEQMERTLMLARLLKDADNMDRVRLGDFNPRFLRSPAARSLADFAPRLFALDQALKKQ